MYEVCIGQVRLWQLRKNYKYKLDLVEVQKVRRDRGGTEPEGEYKMYFGKGNENHEFYTGCFVQRELYR
jgi:hypothetical protein